MIYPILTYGNKTLRQISSPITQRYPQLNILLNDMFETMHKAKGIGLSAIQIGLPLRLFIIEAKFEDIHFKEIFINPIIIKEFGNTVDHPEGCLSIPSLTATVSRPENISIEYFNKKWEKQTKEYSGWISRIIQHEYDHLDGKLYIDNLKPMWSSILEVPLKIIEDERMPIKYLTKSRK